MESFSCGDVVWCTIEYGYPRWPCKVIEMNDDGVLELLSFGDNVEYSKKLNTLIGFTDNEQTKELIKNGKKKLKNKKSVLNDFLQSLIQAIEAVKEHDPEISFDKDLISDISVNEPSITDTSMASPLKTSTPSTKSRFGRTVKKMTPTNIPPLSSSKLSSKCKATLKRSTKMDTSSNITDNNSSFISPPLDGLLESPNESLSSRKRSRHTPNTSKRRKQDTIDNEYSLDDLAEQTTETSNDLINISVNSSKKIRCLPTDENCSSTTDMGGSSPKGTQVPIQTELSYNDSTGSCDDALKRYSSVLSDNSRAETTPHSLSKDSASSDDELPPCNFANDTNDLNNLKPNDIIWAKCPHYPFWPAIVGSVKKKMPPKKKTSGVSRVPTKIQASVYFLGYDDDRPVLIKNMKHLASYNYQNKEKLKREGLKNTKEPDMFEIAIKEAEELKRLRIEKVIIGSPLEQAKLMIARRPKKDKDTNNLNTELHVYSSQPTSEDEPLRPSASAFGFDIGSTQKELFVEDESSSDGEWIEEGNEHNEENINSPYSYEKVMKHLEEIKPILVDISKGQRHSDLHEIYFKGPKKEREIMKFSEKFGPVKLNQTHEQKVLQFIQEAVKDCFNGIKNFPYALDVLLPEAIVRMMSTVESCSIQRAWELFSQTDRTVTS